MAKSSQVLDPYRLTETPAISKSADPIDWTKCILCQKTSKEPLQCPADSSVLRTDADVQTIYDNFASTLLRFNELGSLQSTINIAGLDDGTGVASTLMSHAAKWHKKCKDNYNNTKLKRAEKRYTEDNDSPQKKVTRYSTGGAAITSQETCFFCGKQSDKLHKASMFKLDTNVRRCATILKDDILIAKLSAGDMIAQDAMYHGKCLKDLYKRAELVNRSDNSVNSTKQLKGIALAELITYIEECRSMNKLLELATLTRMYTSRLNDLGVDTSDREHSTRLKERILANIPDLQAHKVGKDVLLAFEDDIGVALRKLSDFDGEGIILAKADGAAIINMLKPGPAKTFQDYSDCIFLPYIQTQLHKASRIDIVWDEYIPDSLKAMTRERRGKGTRRRVQPDTKIPGNWEAFLRVNENKMELFAFLAQQSVSIECEQTVISTFGKMVLLNSPREDISRLSPCTHEEADTRLLLHAADAAADGYNRVMLRTVDTDVVVLSIALFHQSNLTEPWVSFGTGKHRRIIPAHIIAQTMGPHKALSLLMLHTFTGCDQTSFFLSKGKKTAWETSKVFTDIDTTFASLVQVPPTEQTLKAQMPTIERFVVLMYDRTSSCTSVDDARRELFTQKGRSIELIPHTSAALYQHTKRAAYMAGHCWGQALLRAPELPEPAEWGWRKGTTQLWEPLWTILTEASNSCKELLKCGCNVDRGCRGRCKCVKAGMSCTSYCKCHGNCERH